MEQLKKYQLGILGVNSKSLVYESLNIDQEITKVNPVKALTSGKFASKDIGKTIYLSNSVAATQEWRIADVNHDGTIGTVDLFPKYCLFLSGDDYGISYRTDGDANVYYKTSNVRTWLNRELYNGFSDEIKNIIKAQEFSSNVDAGSIFGGILCDNIKCPSLTELGLCGTCYGQSNIIEGSIYPLFGSQISGQNPLASFKALSGNRYYSDYVWTRSRAKNSYTWSVYNGCPDYTVAKNSLNVIGIIRF